MLGAAHPALDRWWGGGARPPPGWPSVLLSIGTLTLTLTLNLTLALTLTRSS